LRALTTIVAIEIIPPLVYIPNVFNPDENQSFTIYANEVVEIIEAVYIYDRWGNLVFENENFPPNDMSIGWDGYMNGGKVEQGVYMYLFVYELDGRTQYDAGDITLLRK